MGSIVPHSLAKVGKDAKVQDFVDSFVLYTSELLQSAAVYLIVDTRIIALKCKQD